MAFKKQTRGNSTNLLEKINKLNTKKCSKLTTCLKNILPVSFFVKQNLAF